MFTVPLTRWVDLREPSLYWRRSAHLPEIGAAGERRVNADIEILRRVSSRLNRSEGRRRS